MNFKQTIWLFGTLLVLLVGLLLTQLNQPSATEGNFVLPSLNEQNVKSKDIDTVVIARTKPKEEQLTFTRSESGWRIDKPAVRADSIVVDQLIDQVIRAGKEEKAVDLTSNLKQYGLDAPSAVVTLKKGDKQWKLNLGDESAGGKENALVYVNSSDLPKDVMAVRRMQIDNCFKSVNEFRSRDLLSEGVLNYPDAVTYLKIQGEKGEPVVFEKNDKSKWRFIKPPFGDVDEGGEFVTSPGGQDNRQSGLRGILTDLGGFRVDSDADFIADDVTDPAKYGLDESKPVWLKIEVQRKQTIGGDSDKDKIVDAVLLVGNKTDEKGEKRYARLAGENAVFAITVKKLQPLVEAVEKPDTLRNRDLVALDTLKVDAIDIQNSEGTFQLRKTGVPETWRLYQGAAKIGDANFSAVQDLIKDLNTKKQIKEFPEAAKSAEYGFDKPSAVVSIWLEGVKKEDDKTEEKKDDAKKDDKKDDKKDAKKEDKKDTDIPKLKTDKPTIRLVFGKKVGTAVYVKREMDADSLTATVPDTLLTRLGQGALAYRDRTLPSFSENADVVRLALQRANESFVIEKEKKDDKTIWKIKEPKELTGKNADPKTVDKVLMELRRLRPERLIAEKAADLDKFGLKQPQIKATVTIKKDEKSNEDWVYLFGKEGDGGLYGKQGAHDLVYVAPPRELEALTRGELQDPVVFNFDVAKVQSVKCSGWDKLGLGTVVLELARTPGKTWLAKAPANFPLDQETTEVFVKGLADLATTRFIARNADPKPEYKVDAKDRQLLIEISLEGEKTPLTLTLGELDTKEKSYYAVSSTLPRDVFLLPMSRFETMLNSGLKYFSKRADKR